MATRPSYRKKIFDALHRLGTTIGDPNTIDFKMIAKEAHISVSNISREFKDLSHLFYEISVEKFKEHEALSTKITRLPGVYALPSLLKHDLKMIFYFARDSKNLDGKIKADAALDYVKDYIETKMPDFYFDILRYNPNLLPNSDINAKLYSQFIVHSLFFFTKKELHSIEPNSRWLTDMTRKLINSLFSSSKATIKIE
ncbi:hypothetical protein N9772_05605 [Bacteroidia bacterium]|nr:hypothetical protein [Bacteroidia bacterium]